MESCGPEMFKDIVFEGEHRYYREDLSERDYSLENTTPHRIEIGGYAIEDHAWGNMLVKVADLLLALYPEKTDRITEFRCPWTSAVMVSETPRKNFKPFFGGRRFLNCNHTALHSCWALQDLLDFFGVDKSGVTFLIHRPCGAESEEMKAYLEERFQRDFVPYVMAVSGKDRPYAEKVLSNIDKYLNPLLKKHSGSYPNFYLFDNRYVMLNYAKKIRGEVDRLYYSREKARKALNRYLDYLSDFYRAGFHLPE